MDGAFLETLFSDEPAGTFAHGHVFRTPPDLTGARQNPANGYWHCDVSNHDNLTWSEKVYELFGLPAGAPIEREWAVGRYSEASRIALERVRTFGLNRQFGFILDAEINPEDGPPRWIRVLAFPIMEDGRAVGLHGVKRAL